MSLGQWAAVGATGVVIAGSLTAYAAVGDALSFETEAIEPDAWGDRPASVDGIHNVLVLGTDERAGDDAGYNEENGVRPDVLMIASIDTDNGGATMVNLPRDLVVDLPACEGNDEYPGSEGGEDQLNHAMRYGGLDCQGNAVENVTGVHIDHMVAVDFAGFENIVDSVGGVEMCVPEPVDDPNADLHLEAGEQRLDGAEALGLARSRDSTDLGSDLGRIENQQRMIGAILREVQSGEILTSPSTLRNFLDSVTDSLVTDQGFTLDVMMELAVAMREVDLENMHMVTVPVDDHPADPNKVTFQEPAAQELLDALASGEALPGADGGDGGGDGGSGEGSGSEGGGDADPSDVSLRVLNNTGQDGLATEVETMLNEDGFTVTGTGNPEERVPDATTIYHGPGQDAEAELLASALTTATTEEVPELEGDLELVMGSDWGPVEGLDGSGTGDAELDELGGTTAADDDVVCE
ncbi:LCP family protein [Nocardiopsis salina]|uniref:LCP family protein n=1 Tax=Nocardiopsis salina TaxID=245836 RepID=UPI00034B4FE6|nr:LCP family protein [Nocardiopsis salina]